MPRNIQDPVTVQTDRKSGSTETETTHPAFATIGLSRISGHAKLFQSDHHHQYYIAIRIQPATLMRGLNRDWVHAGMNPYIEVSLSEAQWATFVASAGMGGGVPCTLNYRNGKPVPEIGEIKPRVAQFNEELDKDLKKTVAAIDAEIKAFDDDIQKLPAKRRDALKSLLSNIKGLLEGRIPFIQEQFHEHIENVVQSGMSEIEAHRLHKLAEFAQRGMQALEVPGHTDLMVSPESIDKYLEDK